MASLCIRAREPGGREVGEQAWQPALHTQQVCASWGRLVPVFFLLFQMPRKDGLDRSGLSLCDTFIQPVFIKHPLRGQG